MKPKRTADDVDVLWTTLLFFPVFFFFSFSTRTTTWDNSFFLLYHLNFTEFFFLFSILNFVFRQQILFTFHIKINSIVLMDASIHFSLFPKRTNTAQWTKYEMFFVWNRHCIQCTDCTLRRCIHTTNCTLVEWTVNTSRAKETK